MRTETGRQAIDTGKLSSSVVRVPSAETSPCALPVTRGHNRKVLRRANHTLDLNQGRMARELARIASAVVGKAETFANVPRWSASAIGWPASNR